LSLKANQPVLKRKRITFLSGETRLLIDS